MELRYAAGFSVSELNQLIADRLRTEPGLRNVRVTAEVSGFKHHLASGHWYFSLKDSQAAISCVMFRQNTFHAAIRPRDGDQITVTGYVEMFARDGRVQLYVTELKAAGVGSLYERFEALKRKLSSEGLFDPARKRLVPRFPRKVAVITSASGAALHDILNVSGQRSPSIPIVLIPSNVQGAAAADELIRALKKVSLVPDVDTVIIARGGGSAEDLWCFNEEGLARAIVSCPVPVVSGVGHETDFTICDYAADYRASTPSNAAEVVFPDRDEILSQLNFFRSSLQKAMNEMIHAFMLRVYACRSRLDHLSPERIIQERIDLIRQSGTRLERSMESTLQRQEEKLIQLRTALEFGTDRMMRTYDFQIQQARTRLRAISPLSVLDRGYALIYDIENRILPDARSAGAKPEMKIRFRDGTLDVLRKETSADGKTEL